MRRVKSFLNRKETRGNLKYFPGGSSKRVFGAQLDPKYPNIPDVLVITTKYIEDRALSEEGLFRVSGNATEINKLRSLLDKGESIDLTTVSNPNVVAGVLKQYLRELPEPLFTFSLYDALIASHIITDPSTRLSCIKNIIQKVPTHYFVILDFLIAFLYRICKHSRTHKMDSVNLAIVFGPNLMRAKTETPEQIVADSPKVTTMIKLIIEHYQELFEKDPFTGDFLDFETRPFAELFRDDYVAMYKTINLDEEIAAIYSEEVDFILAKEMPPSIFEILPSLQQQQQQQQTNNQQDSDNELDQSIDEPPSLYVDGLPSSLIGQQGQSFNHRLSIRSNSSQGSSPDTSNDSSTASPNNSPSNKHQTNQQQSSFIPVSPRNNNNNNNGHHHHQDINIGSGRLNNNNNQSILSDDEDDDHHSHHHHHHHNHHNHNNNQEEEKLLAIKKLIDDSILRLENDFNQLAEDFKQELTIQEILLIASSMKNIMNVIKEGPDVDFKVVSALDMDMDMTLFTSETEQVKRLEGLRGAIQHKTARIPSYLGHFKEEAEQLTGDSAGQVDREVCLGGLVRIMRTLKAVGDILDFFYSKWRGSTDQLDEHDQSNQRNSPTDERDIIQRLTDIDSILNDIEESLVRIQSKSELIFTAKIIQNLHKITKLPLSQQATFDDIAPPKTNTLKVTPKKKLAPLISVIYVLIKEIRDDIHQMKDTLLDHSDNSSDDSDDNQSQLKSFDSRINDINRLLKRTNSYQQKQINIIQQNNNNNNNRHSLHSRNNSTSGGNVNSTSPNGGVTPKLSSSPISGLGGSSLLGKVLFDQLTNAQNLSNMRTSILHTLTRMKPLLENLVIEINKDDIALDCAMKISRAVTQMKKTMEDPELLSRTGIQHRSNPSLRSINLSTEIINQQSKESKINALKTLTGVLVDNVISKLDSIQDSVPNIQDEKNMTEVVNLLKAIVEMIRDVNRSLI